MSFQSEEKKIASKQGIPIKNAGAILAAGARKASPEARRENPKLNKVGGMPNMAGGCLPPNDGNSVRSGEAKMPKTGGDSKWAKRSGDPTSY